MNRDGFRAGGLAETDIVTPRGTERDKSLRHLYPYGGVNGDNAARVGAVAYCGWVRRDRWKGKHYCGPTPDHCVVCVEMARAEGW